MTEKSKILIVDDKEANLFGMKQTLKEVDQDGLPIEIITAISGNEALKIALHHDFALIILDVQMPEMDGYELAKLLRGKKETQKVPIMFISAVYTTAYSVFKGYKTGAVDFLTKPVDSQIIVNKVKTFVELDQQKKELEQQREWLEVTLSSIGDAVIATDITGIINFINPVAEKLTEWKNQEAIGQYIKDVFPIINEHTRQTVENPLEIALKEGTVTGLANDTILITRYKKEIPIDDSASPIKIKGSIQGAVLIFRDITDRKKMEENLLQTKKDADAANQAKSTFLANMSHELRTPLNSIIGFTGIILQGIVGELNDEQKKQLNMVYESAKHLLGLINDILDLSKIEAGKIEIIPAEFKVRELIRMVGKMVSPIAEKKGLTLEVTISDDVPPTINSYKNRIKQVLINLLSNATKFTESGEIRLNAEYSISDFGMGNADLRNSAIRIPQSEIRFSVADTGIGIKPEHLSDIFDEFKQIEGPLKEKPTGTGLGLAISKKMVEMMGGRIWVESEYGKGSCFQFTIPVKEIIMANRPPAISPEALDLSKKLILTIDDEVESQEILKVYLKTEGYEVIQAYNAMEVMELARKYRPFAITLDILMPGKDGWDILQELKEEPQTELIPVICISILDNREMGLFLGAFEYLVKPITKEQLMKELYRLEKRFHIYDILIVDDEPQAVELLAQYLGGETNNYRIAKAFGGKEGLAVVKERRPDLIILDLMMPEIDGFEVIRHLKKSEGTKDIPIIIVSAKKLTQEEVEYLNRNIEKLIRKGDFSKQELLKDIKKALEGI